MVLFVMCNVSICFAMLTPEEVEVVKYNQFILARDAWIQRLRMCESSGIDEKINPKDTDGTPSYYAFQFKPSTFRMYAIRYKLISKFTPNSEIMKMIRSYEIQKEIVEKMIEDPKVKWRNEFPACVKKLGYPPKFINK